jgi:zinc protease
VVNVLYNAGARDEDPELTGMAHLFEHLMFSGSAHAESYDSPLQKASGENNAFTSNDITNYYVTLPAENIETALWLESDRMQFLNINQKSLDIQKSVVIEEFKQRYINQPYGDLWTLLRPLAYEKHPYGWPTIGKDLSHIEKVQLSDLEAFYSRFYHPANAILVIAGNIEADKVKQLVIKWFGDLKPGIKNRNVYPEEPVQKEKRIKKAERDVPQDVLTLSFHCGKRNDPSFYSLELLCDILGSSHSSRLYQRLVKEKKLFTEIGCYNTESLDNGLLLIQGRLSPGKSFEEAESAIWEELASIQKNTLNDKELEKVKNKKLTLIKYQELEILNKAMNLAFFENIGDVSLINKEEEKYTAIVPEDLRKLASELLTPANCSILYYQAKK